MCIHSRRQAQAAEQALPMDPSAAPEMMAPLSLLLLLLVMYVYIYMFLTYIYIYIYMHTHV